VWELRALIDLNRDGNDWLAFVKAVMKLRVLWNGYCCQ
jgi:hypothetical protein